MRWTEEAIGDELAALTGESVGQANRAAIRLRLYGLLAGVDEGSPPP
jgi:hypothetical protein